MYPRALDHRRSIVARNQSLSNFRPRLWPPLGNLAENRQGNDQYAVDRYAVYDTCHEKSVHGHRTIIVNWSCVGGASCRASRLRRMAVTKRLGRAGSRDSIFDARHYFINYSRTNRSALYLFGTNKPLDDLHRVTRVPFSMRR